MVLNGDLGLFHCDSNKQCRPWSDAAFCVVRSGSALFAKVPNVPVQVLQKTLGLWKTSLEKRKTSDINQSTCVTAIRPELPCLVDKLIQKSIIIACQLLITCSVVSATADCRKYEIFLNKKNNTTDRNVKKGPKSLYLILMKQKPNFSAGFSAQNATSKNIPNCNLNELLVS